MSEPTGRPTDDLFGAVYAEFRAIGGLTLEEAADVLGVSRATAARSWAYAKAWLYQRLAANLQRE